MSRLQRALVATLLAATAVFAVGAIAERSQSDTHAEPAATRSHEESEGTGSEADHLAGGEVGHGEELFGINTESTPVIALAVIAGLGFAAVAASSLGRRMGVLIVLALVMAIWTALDVREVAHQLDESRAGIAILATIAAVLHLTAAVLAGALVAHARRAAIGSRDRAGTMPA